MAERFIDRYRIVRRLGAGGMGEVLEGFDDQLRRPVALKGLPADVDDETSRRRLRQEALATASLNHPAIAHVYEIVTEGSRDWLVMEYIDGQTIAETLRSGPLRFDEVARIGETVARALQAAHEKGILHRDVKTENVMVTTDGHVKVLDFGLAKHTMDQVPDDQRLTLNGTVLGTSRAMSPEQALGRPLDRRSDVFSLGSLMYEMTTGHPAFRGATAAETLVLVARAEHVPLSEAAPAIPAELSATIERCLDPDPDSRFSSAGEVAERLRWLRATAAQATAAMPSAAVGRTTLVRQRRWPIPAAVAAVLAAILLMVSIWGRHPEAIVVAVAPVSIPGSRPSELVAPAIGDAIRTSLGRRRGLIVVPERETAVLRGDERSGGQLAAEVGASEVIEASVVGGGSGDTLRITLSRIGGDDGRILWSAQTEADRGLLLHVEARVAAALEGAYAERLPLPSPATRDLSEEALTAYLRAVSRGEDGAYRVPPHERTVALERALSLAPRWLEAGIELLGALGEEWRVTHDATLIQRSRAVLDELGRYAPSDPRVGRSRIRLAIIENRSDDALGLARDVIRGNDGDSVSWLALAGALTASGRLDEARDAVDRAIAIRPSWHTSVAAAELLWRFHRSDLARTRLADALARSADNPVALTLAVEIELASGDLAAAERAATRLVESRSTADANCRLAEVLLDLRRWPAAAEAYRRAAAVEPADPEPVVGLATALLADGHVDAGRQAAAEALRLCHTRMIGEPGDATVLGLRAAALACLGRHEEAVLQAGEALIKAPGDPETALAAALVAALSGDRRSCLAWARNALALGIPVVTLQRVEFDAVRELPDFRDLVTNPPTPKGPWLLAGWQP